MNIIGRLKWRWEHCGDPLPGELNPINCGPFAARVVWASHGEDAERRVLARRLRGLLTGYGEGWTLRAALGDWAREGLAKIVSVPMVMLALPLLLIFVLLHEEE